MSDKQRELGKNERWVTLYPTGTIADINKTCPWLGESELKDGWKAVRMTLLETADVEKVRELIDKSIQSTWESAKATEKFLREALSILGGGA